MLIHHWNICIIDGLASAGNKEPHGRPPPTPSWWDEQENQKEKAKLVCWDKNSLTEQQREKKITMTLITRIYSSQCSHHAMLSLLLSSKSPCLSQLPHLTTEHVVAWYRISHLIVWFGSAQLASCEN